MTDAERKLWACLRSHRLEGIGFRRQHPIGCYIVDFCAPRKKIIIELDGNQHESQLEYDTGRSEYLKLLGYTVIRIGNWDVLTDLAGVIERIQMAIDLQDQ
jgi:very-short-patch-repair endonuclease